MNRFLKTTVLALMACGLSTPAWATLTVQYGTSTPLPAGDPLAIPGGTTCVDGGACDGQAGIANLMSIDIGGLGTVTIGATGTIGGVNTIGFTVNGIVSGPTTLYFAISEIGYSSVPAPLQLINSAIGLDLGGGVVGTVTSQGWMDDGNQLFGTTPGGTTTVASTAIGAGEANGSSSTVGSANPYSMTLLVTVNITGVGSTLGGNFQANGNLGAVPVPEPGSMFLLGGALLVTGKLVRKKLAKA